jgi:hypothetical protein
MSTANKLFQAASGGAGEPVYVEDVFSTYLYTGNSSTKVITNGIDLAGEGGLVWGKSRDNAFSHMLVDTERGGDKGLSSNATSAEYDNSAMITSFNSNGFTLGSYLGLNYNGDDVASWTFRKQAGFLSIVTWTGDGTSNRQIAHNLGSVPGCIIVKRLNDAANWAVWHRGFNSASTIGGAFLNLTNAFGNEALFSNNSSSFSDSYFLVSSSSNRETNGFLDTYVAYVFAHDDQQFGDNSDESIIKCGSYTGNGNVVGPLIDLGFEPQFIMIKAASRTGHWFMLDVMRGIITGSSDSSPGSNKYLLANSNGAEGITTSINVNSTGFQPRTTDDSVNENSATYIYMAIRRPMKTPEAGTEVFNGVLTSSDSSTTTGFPVDIGFPVDLAWVQYTTLATGALWMQRLTGLTANPQPGQGKLAPSGTTAQANSGELWGADNMTGYRIYGHTYQRICYGFKRATGFMDMVAYTGNGSASGQVIKHNLAATPELIILKGRSNSSRQWHTYVSALGQDKALFIEDNGAVQNNTAFVGGTINTTQFELKVDFGNVNGNGETYIAYLFATLAGVSKVGSVVHSGTTNVDCGFSAGARFILIKRTDSTGDWYYWDTMRGIVAGNDDYLLLNSDAVEVTNTDYIDPLSSGFTLTSSFTAGTYIFLAIA